MLPSLFQKYFPFRKFKIQEKSMEPYLKDGDKVIVLRFVKIKINDVIVFQREKKIYIKRIKKVSNGKFFVVGDNKKESYDSRKFGFINKKDVIGKVVWKL